MDTVVGPSAPVPPGAFIAAATLALAFAGALGWWIMRRRAANTIAARLGRAGEGLLAGVLIPNAEAGQIHIQYAVRTRQGIVVVDVREAAGHVFGSETMQDWTVLSHNQRFTFGNPLPALYDRVAAVRRIAPDVPARGVVVFMPGAEFTKGFPPNVSMLDALIAELSAARVSGDGPPPDVLEAGWAALRREASRS